MFAFISPQAVTVKIKKLAVHVIVTAAQPCQPVASLTMRTQAIDVGIRRNPTNILKNGLHVPRARGKGQRVRWVDVEGMFCDLLVERTVPAQPDIVVRHLKAKFDLV